MSEEKKESGKKEKTFPLKKLPSLMRKKYARKSLGKLLAVLFGQVAHELRILRVALVEPATELCSGKSGHPELGTHGGQFRRIFSVKYLFGSCHGE